MPSRQLFHGPLIVERIAAMPSTRAALQYFGLKFVSAALFAAILIVAEVAKRDADAFQSVSEAAEVMRDRTLSHRKSRRDQVSPN